MGNNLVLNDQLHKGVMIMEVQVGHVTHYYNHLGVAAVELEGNDLKVGDMIHIKGHATDITQPVESIELEHNKIPEAHPGENIGIKVQDHVREHDTVFKITLE
jgi:putative protease